MPLNYGRQANKKGRAKCWVRWGTRKKYYFTCGNKVARARAKAKAEAQRTAIFSSGWTGR